VRPTRSPLPRLVLVADSYTRSVVETLRLADGALFPMPITLDVSQEQIDSLKLVEGTRVTLRDSRDESPLAILTSAFPLSSSSLLPRARADALLALAVSSIYKPNKSNEAEKVFGADDSAHPAVHYLHNSVKDFYVGGNVQAIYAPEHYDYVELRCASLSLPGLLTETAQS